MADDTTDFFLFSAVDRLATVGGGSVFVWTDEFAAVSVEAVVSGVATAASSAAFVEAVPWD